MYDILQLNDMLVPELLDIAEELKIETPKKLDKQELIYKILDKQAVMSSQQKGNPNEKPKRKRIVKASTANTTEEAVVEESGTDEAPDNKSKIAKKVAPRKEAPAKEAPKKTPRKKSDDQQELDLNEDDQQDQQVDEPTDDRRSVVLEDRLVGEDVVHDAPASGGRLPLEVVIRDEGELL